MLGSLILYLKGMRIMMFQLSGFYCTVKGYLIGTPATDLFAPPTGLSQTLSPKGLKPCPTCPLGGPFDLVSRVSKVGYGGL